MTIIYGVDLEKQITPLMVRDALVECFYKAHCEDTGIDDQEEGTNKTYCKTIVEKAFKDTDGNFESPTQGDIEHVMEHLAEFSKSFRDPEIIKRHAAELKKLVEKLKKDSE